MREYYEHDSVTLVKLLKGPNKRIYLICNVLPMKQSAIQLERNGTMERRVWYLLLLLGFPVRTSGRETSAHLRCVRGICKPIGVKIRRLLVNRPQHHDMDGRYLFRFLRYRRDDLAAIRLAESFLYGLSLAHGPMIGPDHDSLVLRVPDTLVSEQDAVWLEELAALEESRPPEDRMLNFPKLTLERVRSTTMDSFEAAWRIAGATFTDNQLFEATRFLKSSHDNFYIYPGQIRQVASDPEMVPLTSSHQTDFENALHNAFKAVEAVIGDPPKDDRRFFRKLREIGLDPLEEVGYTAKKPIHQVIRAMNQARDAKAAHGSTRDRAIKATDLLNYQTCSGYVLTAALEAKIGAPIFP